MKLIAGYAGWARAQLDAELARNVWFHVDVDDVAALSMMQPEGAGEGAAWLRDAMWSGLVGRVE